MYMASCHSISCSIRLPLLCTVLPQGNALRSTAGLEALLTLEVLDLRCNVIASLQEVARLAGGLWEHGNYQSCSCASHQPTTRRFWLATLYFFAGAGLLSVAGALLAVCIRSGSAKQPAVYPCRSAQPARAVPGRQPAGLL